MNQILVLALGIGIVAGLRSLTAPAVIAWAAHLHWINLQGSHLNFMASTAAVTILSLLALGELIVDKLPTTPKRTAVVPLLVRAVTGGLSAACLSASANHSLGPAIAAGVIGVMIGAFAGYETRRRIVAQLHMEDFFVALAEDIIAIGFAIFIATR